MEEGRIIGLSGGNYQIFVNDDETYSCRARGKLRSFRVDKESSFNMSNPNSKSKKIDTKNIKLSPKVGDIVTFDKNDCFVIDVLPRKNQMIRPDISNVDQILLIFASKKPDFSFYLLDLFLVNIEKEKIKPIIIISKCDLLSDRELEELKQKMSYYELLGYKVIFISSKTKCNVDIIKGIIKDKVSILSGQTGAGKSTLINALIPGFCLNTQEISEALGRGKHTTRETTLYRYFGGFIGDTPGFSKLDLSAIEEKELKNYFIEFKNYRCKFKDCLHIEGTKECGIIEEAQKNLMLNSRLKSYLKMLVSIREG